MAAVVTQTAADPRRWWALPVLLIGAFLPILDFNVVNLALPAIRQNLGASGAELQFVISAYAAAYAVFLITGGRLGDLFGRRRMFLAGLAGFTLASVLCGAAWTPAILIAGRILQGLTATAMAPQVLASIRVLFPPDEQGQALGFYGATFGLANIAGQILGGVLVSAHPFGFGWQAIFLINVPIGLLAFFGALAFLGDSRAERAKKLDWGGVALLSITLTLLVYPLVAGREAGWPAWTFILLALFPLALAAFIGFERGLSRRGGSPLVELSLFGRRGFAIGVAMALVFYMLSAFYLTFSVYLQPGLGLSPLASGLRTLPFGVGYFVASFAAVAIVRRLGPRALTLGFAIQVAGFGAAALAVGGGAAQALGPALVTAGIGFGIVMPSVIGAVIGGVDARHAGLASGVIISTFQVGSALGVAIVGGIFFTVLGADHGPAAYAHAFSVALGCNVALLALGGLLSIFLPDGRRKTN
jgi:EmrB/QacA subfamily drug resistance transporter